MASAIDAAIGEYDACVRDAWAKTKGQPRRHWTR